MLLAPRPATASAPSSSARPSPPRTHTNRLERRQRLRPPHGAIFLLWGRPGTALGDPPLDGLLANPHPACRRCGQQAARYFIAGQSAAARRLMGSFSEQ